MHTFLKYANNAAIAYSHKTGMSVLQGILAEPDMQHVVNADAASAMNTYPSVYQQIVERCVAASQTLHSTFTAVCVLLLSVTA